jgi:glycosyltransferase involved in cell wall biosynthesis
VPTVVLDLTALDTDSRLRGFGRYVLTLARGLASVPHGNITLLGLTHLDWSGNYRVTERIDAFRGEADVKINPSKQHLAWAYRRRVALATAVRRIGADLVHLPTPEATPLGMWTTRCKKLVTCHDLMELRSPEHYLTWMKGGPLFGPAILRRRYRSADHVLAISETSANDLRRFLHVPDERITRVYNAIDHDKWRPERKPTDAATAQRYGLAGAFLLYVGDLDWRKNLEGMLAGLAHARKEGSDVTLAFAGRLSADKRARVEAMANELHVADAIRLLDYVPDEDLAALYRCSLGHLFVSRDEGFGLTVVEAMACGAPVITTNGGSLGEVAGGDALLVDPEDASAIGGAIVSLQRDPGLRERLRRQGITRASRFSIDRQAEETFAIYRRLVS